MPNKLRKIKFTMFKKGKGRGRNVGGGRNEEEKERHQKRLVLSIYIGGIVSIKFAFSALAYSIDFSF